MGADAAWRVMGFVLRVSCCFDLACVKNDWRIACWKLRWFPAVVLTCCHVFPVVFELNYLLLEHVVFSDDLEFCLWEML